MDVGTINAMLALIMEQMIGMLDVLTPIGQGLAMSVVVISTVLFGLAFAQGGGSVLMGPLFKYAALGSLTFWVLNQWGDIVMNTLRSCRAIIGMLLPGGYDGPATLFTLGGSIVARMEIETGLRTLISGGLVQSLFLAIAEVLIWAGFAIVSIVAIVAEVQLLVAATLAPLVLPFMALGVTASIGAAPIRFLLSSSVKCVALGVICATIQGAATEVINVAGIDETFASSEVCVLLALSLIAAVLAVGSSSIASGLTGGGFGGGMGFSSVQHAGSVVSGGVRGATTVASAGARGAVAAAHAAGKAGVMTIGTRSHNLFGN